MEWQIPPRAQEMLRHFLDVRQQAEAELAAAMRLVLAAVDAPDDAQLVVYADGSMLVTIPNVGKDSESASENATDSP